LTYSYICKDCGNEFEIEKGINEEVIPTCKCGCTDVSRINSVPVFKNNMSDICGKIEK
jgi:putative FmdB family regulatory protein